jgi:hypothetical protein
MSDKVRRRNIDPREWDISPIIPERFHRLDDRVISIRCVNFERCHFIPPNDCVCRNGTVPVTVAAQGHVK